MQTSPAAMEVSMEVPKTKTNKINKLQQNPGIIQNKSFYHFKVSNLSKDQTV